MAFRISGCVILMMVMCFLPVVFAEAAGIKTIPPSEACSMLDGFGLSTRGWQTYYDDECGCSSRARALGSGNPFRNTLSYFVDGKGQTVHQMRLIVNVLNPDASEMAVAGFKKTARFLLIKIMRSSVPESIFNAISNKTNMIYNAGGFYIQITHKKWTMNMDRGPIKGYEIRLTVQ